MSTKYKQHHKFKFIWITSAGELYSSRLFKDGCWIDINAPNHKLKLGWSRGGYRRLMTLWNGRVRQLNCAHLVYEAWHEVRLTPKDRLTYIDGDNNNLSVKNLELMPKKVRNVK